MKQVGNMKLYSLEEVKDELIGKIGTPERDEHERKVEDALHAYRIGEAIKNARLKQNLTQEELGERIGVQKAQISRMERGNSISLPTMSRVFKALGITTATLDLGIAGKVTLW
ncbi:helix-turn-helix domain protein [Prevotella sp. CAG:1185]|uniref:helix-turn-helix domain-containing protein n=1 Tax=uncultured Prevotella sp. TaxID=159272 RepID=UPI0003407191|nr:helix-turn-helix transcriptional regulator [uncultured Prevotella sp.]CCY81937.1 helix-turn-helix domain protein [Prevotella sp. CAG:1185]